MKIKKIQKVIDEKILIQIFFFIFLKKKIATLNIF
jgi:hypothetical protein